MNNVYQFFNLCINLSDIYYDNPILQMRKLRELLKIIHKRKTEEKHIILILCWMHRHWKWSCHSDENREYDMRLGVWRLGFWSLTHNPVGGHWKIHLQFLEVWLNVSKATFLIL